MSSAKPIIYLLYGDDILAVQEIVHTLRERIGEPTVADLNSAEFSVQNLDLAEFETVCATMPFLAKRRLVLLTDAHLITRKTPWLEKFLGILSACPEQTALVLHAHVDSSDRKSLNSFQEKSPILQWVQEHSEICWKKACLIPMKAAFDQWIVDRVHSHGGEIDRSAAHALAEVTMGDPLLADLEILKLLDYTDYQRSITAADIEKLTPLHGQADIFTLVDALGNRDASAAINELHHLQEEMSIPVIFSMITRQFRLLIQARDYLNQGLDPVKEMGVHSFVGGKISNQARNFELDQLKAIFASLQQIDLDMKSSSIDVSTILDSLIAEFTHTA